MWRTFQGVETERIFGKTLNAEIEAIQEEIQRIETNRRGIDEAIEKSKTSDVESIDFDNLIGFPMVKSLLATTLQDEIKVRRRMAAVYDSAREAYSKEAEKAHGRHLKAQEEVRASLVQIGYLDELPTSGVPGRIMPGDILKHPKVSAAQNELAELRHHANNRDLSNHNELALAHAMADLEKAREQATTL